MTRPTSRVSQVIITGLLAHFADACAQELYERAYTQRSAVNLRRQMARLSRW